VKEDEIWRPYGKYRGSRVSYRILVGKPEGKRPVGTPRLR